MNIEELVKMPEPDGTYEANKVPHPGGGYEYEEGPALSLPLVRAYGEAVAAAVAKRCADLCQQSDEDGEGPDCWGWHSKDYADAIRREFGEASK